ncbi:MAG TPA: hemerythrin domain-containing protein, partial [Casimicrobiaceae bacterium]|nr:hemerythrin domain-containing protein [Casimicrobiaceae bacterium]
MSYDRQVSRALDDEHRANIALFERVERALAKSSPDTAELAQLAVALCRQIEQDVGRHFDFEERELFPRMTDAGDGEMAALLAAEHAAIRATATALLPLAQRAAEDNLDAAGLAAMKRLAL